MVNLREASKSLRGGGKTQIQRKRNRERERPPSPSSGRKTQEELGCGDKGGNTQWETPSRVALAALNSSWFPWAVVFKDEVKAPGL